MAEGSAQLQEIFNSGGTERKNAAPTDILLAVAVLVSVLAICNHELVSRVCSFALYAVWGMLAVVLVVANHRLRFNLTFAMLVGVWVFTFLQNQLFWSLGFYRTGGLGVARTLLMCAAFYEIGLNCNTTYKTLRTLLGTYILGAFLLMLFRRSSGLALDSVDKNAIGAVCGAALFAVFILLRRFPVSQKQKYCLYLVAGYIGLTLVSMHTRTPVGALLGTLLSLYMLKHKLAKNMFVGLFLLAIAIYLMPILLEYQGFLDYVQGVKTSDELTLNSVTSDRMGFWSQAWEDIKAHPWIGQGGWAYVDCFPLFVLRQGGLLSALVIFSVTYGKFIHVLQKARAHWLTMGEKNSSNDVLLELATGLVLYYTGASLFEGYTPFGPATSTFFLWLLLGMFDARDVAPEAQAA